MTLTFVDHTGTERDFDQLPDASRKAMAIQRGVAHYFGNEADSAVLGRIRTALEIKAGPLSAEDKARIKAFRAEQSDQASEWLRAEQDVRLKALLEGTIAVRRVGVSVEPMEREIVRIAVQEYLKPFFKAEWPAADGVYKSPKFGNMSQSDLVEWFLGLPEAPAALAINRPDVPANMQLHVGDAPRTVLERQAKRALELKAKRAAAVATAPSATAQEVGL